MTPITTLTRADHVGLLVPDLEEAIAWYQAYLGFQTVDRWSNEDHGMEFAHLEAVGARLEIVQLPGIEDSTPATAGFQHLAFVVDDCNATVNALQAAGVTVVMPPSYFDRHDMDWAFIADHRGNVIELLSYRH